MHYLLSGDLTLTILRKGIVVIVVYERTIPYFFEFVVTFFEFGTTVKLQSEFFIIPHIVGQNIPCNLNVSFTPNIIR